MIKVFVPTDKKVKTSARGFWYSKENKKIYYDYLQIIELKDYPSYRAIENWRVKYNQEAIAIIGDSLTLNIFYANRQEVLPCRLTKTIDKCNHKELKAYIKKWLKEFSGLTIYEDKYNYLLEVFYK